MLCVVLTRKMRYSSIYFITRKYKTDMPFCTIRPAGLGGQIEHQTRLGQFSQFGRAQHSSGNGVDHQIERGEVAGQEAGVERAVSGGFDAGKIARRACGYGDVRAERGQFGGEQAADPAVADDERPRALNGDRQFLHGELKRTLGGGDGVADGQLLAGQIIDQAQLVLRRMCAKGVGRRPRQHQHAGRNSIQNGVNMIGCIG